MLWVFCFYSYSSLADPVKTEVTIPDDGYVEVPLDFAFPFYGQNFTTSFMFSNGVVMFVHPNTNTSYGLCCDGPDVEGLLNGTNTGNQNYILNNLNALNFSISPFLTDLIQRNGQGKFYIQGDETFQRYFWENVMEYYDTTTENTFDLTIKPDGDIAYNYTKLDIKNHQIFVGTVGDLQQNQYKQYFLHNARVDGGYYWTSEQGSQPVWVPENASICEAQPLSDPLCDGYAEALGNQEYNFQCSVDATYDPGCPGYDTANAIGNSTDDISGDFSFDTPDVTGDSIIDDIISFEFDDFDFNFDDFSVAPELVEIDILDFEVPDDISFDLPETSQDGDQMQEIAMLEMPDGALDELPEIQINEEVEEIDENFDEPAIEEEPIEEPAPEETNEEEIDEPEVEEEREEETTEEETTEEEIDEPEPVEEENAGEEEVDQEETKDEKEDKKRKKSDKKSKIKIIIAKKSAEMSERLALATSLEAQIQAQNLAMALINFNQGFGAYRYTMPGGNLQSNEIPYSTKQMSDSNRGLLNGLAQQILHEKMVDMQYK